MGITPADAWRLTWFEFRAVYKAYNDKRIHDFDVMRHGASLSLMAHVDKKHVSKITPSRLFPLPTDRAIEQPRLSEAEALEFVQLAKRRLIEVKEIN